MSLNAPEPNLPAAICIWAALALTIALILIIEYTD